MNRSEPVDKLAEALAKAQGEIKDAAKDTENPFFHSRYADLASVWEACRKPLSDNGLAVIQSVASEADGYVLETMLAHSSGQFIINSVRLLLKDPTMQGLGSAITYARRYQLAALVGVAPDDDDGNAASKPAQVAQAAKPSSQEHFCQEHRAAFFMRGKMKSFAHPIAGQEGQWCYEHTAESRSTPQTVEGKAPSDGTLVDPRTLKFKNPGEFYSACHNILDIAKSAIDPQVSMYDLTNPEQREKAWASLLEQNDFKNLG